MALAAGKKASGAPDRPVEIRILGTITVRLAEQRIHLGDAKHRLMLAISWPPKADEGSVTADVS
jgi:hypothetical protein